MVDEEGTKTGGVSQASNDNGDGKGMAAISYLGILVLIPLLTKKDDPFVKFHVQQGLALLVAGVIWGFAWIILAFIPILGWLIAMAGWVILVVLMVMGIINAVNGAEKPLPILGGFAKAFKI